MKKTKKPNDFIRTPQYPGGQAALDKFLKQNFRYPNKALENKIEGLVEAEYFIDGQGRIVEINILKSLGDGCDEEVIRLIKTLVFDKAINRGLKTKTRKTLKVDFKLPKKPPSVTYQYQLTPDKSSEQSQKPKPAVTYNIRIVKK